MATSYQRPKFTKTAGWDAYARRHRNGAASMLLRRALKLISLDSEIPRIAVDLGCGPGANTLLLQRAGFAVHGVDTNTLALKFTRDRLRAQRIKLMRQDVPVAPCKLRRIAMRDFKIPRCGVIVAMRSLGFETPLGFAKLLKTIPRAVAQDGLLVLQFFGPQDTWVKEAKVQGLSMQAIRSSLKTWMKNFDICEISQKQINRRALIGPVKHWHEIFIIARKR